MKFHLISLCLFLMSCTHVVEEGALAGLRTFIREQTEAGKIDKTKADWKTHLPKFPDVAFAKGETYDWILHTTDGVITVRLDVEAAPGHVRNILYLSELGFYEGIKFHRIIPGFMAQGGCPLGNGGGGPGYRIKREIHPDRKHVGRGVLSMARTPDPDSAGSQFFITFGDTPGLDGGYTVFGKVTDGLAVLDKLEAAGNPREESNGVPPLREIRIEKTEIRRAGDPAATP